MILKGNGMKDHEMEEEEGEGSEEDKRENLSPLDFQFHVLVPPDEE